MEELQQQEKISVAYAPDDKYALYTLISMISIMENTDKEIDFIIMYSRLKKESVAILDTIRRYEKCSITFIKMPEKYFENLRISSWTSVQSWFRIKIPDLKLNLNKIIYLDCDTMVRVDISKLWDIDLKDKLIAGVTDVYSSTSNANRLKMISTSYINAGVLLINCKKWRDEKIFKKIVEYSIKNEELIAYGDQDAINAVIDDDKINLSPRYNYLETWWCDNYNEYEDNELEEYKLAQKDPYIVHFTMRKPNCSDCGNKFKNEWWNYAKRSLFYTKMLEKYREDADMLVASCCSLKKRFKDERKEKFKLSMYKDQKNIWIAQGRLGEMKAKCERENK